MVIWLPVSLRFSFVCCSVLVICLSFGLQLLYAGPLPFDCHSLFAPQWWFARLIWICSSCYILMIASLVAIAICPAIAICCSFLLLWLPCVLTLVESISMHNVLHTIYMQHLMTICKRTMKYHCNWFAYWLLLCQEVRSFEQLTVIQIAKTL